MDHSRKDQAHNLFAALPRRDREAAYKLVRNKIGPEFISIEVLLKAHNYLSNV